MFTWLNNLFPYSDLHSLNLDWILTKMKETAAQAAKAIADSANALAQVIEAKTAAQNAQTAAENAQTSANNAATSAENAVGVAQSAKTTAQNAQTAAQNAQTAAQNAQTTAQNAQTAASNAQTTATNAQTAAETAQTAAQTAQSAAETAQADIVTLNGKFPIKTVDISDKAVTKEKMEYTNCAITTAGTGGENISIPPTSASSAYDVSTIADELNAQGIGAMFTGFNGTYLQCTIKFYKPGGGVDKNIKGSFSTLYWPDRNSADYAAYTTFIFENLTKNKVMRGYAKLKTNDGVNYQFQMFFDTPPEFDAGARFRVTINTVGGVIQPNY